MGLFSRRSSDTETSKQSEVKNANSPQSSSDVPAGFIARAKAIGAAEGFSYEHGGSEGDDTRGTGWFGKSSKS